MIWVTIRDEDDPTRPAAGRRDILVAGAAALVAAPFTFASASAAAPAKPALTLNGMTEHSTTSRRHRTAYLETGPASGPLMIFIHGHPEIGLLWRAQMDYFGVAGWHCVAPDM